MRYVVSAILCAGVLLAGCAIEPTPVQTTGSDTAEIANHIRCEARQAIVRQVVKLLVAFDRTDWAERLRGGDPEAFVLAERHIGDLEPALRKRLLVYSGIAIAYQFTLDVSEENDDRFGLDLLGPFKGGGAALGIGAGLDRTRQNIRIFTVTDTFRDLVRDVEVCKAPAVRIDYVYPLGGRIGMGEAVDTFVDLNELSRKAGGKVLASDKNGNAEVYATTFRFRTTVDATFSPGADYTPVGFGPKHALLTNTAKRVDDHQVIVGFSLPKPGKATLAGLSGAFYGNGDSGRQDDRDTAIHSARQAIKDAKVDYFLQNFRSGLIP